MSKPECIVVLSDDSFSEEKKPSGQPVRPKSVPVIEILDSDDEETSVYGSASSSFAKVKVEVKREKSPDAGDDECLKVSPRNASPNVISERISWLRSKLDISALSAKMQGKAECDSSDDYLSRSALDAAEGNAMTDMIEAKDEKNPLEIKQKGSKVKRNLYDDLDDVPNTCIMDSDQKAGILSNYNSPFSSPIKPKKTTPKKENKLRNLDSPSKACIFGSPSKNFNQTLLSSDSFSPKKFMCEKPTGTRVLDTAPHIPPMHADQQVKSSVYRDFTSIQKIVPFTDSQLHFLDAIKTEGFTRKYLDTVLSYLSCERKPPADLVYNLLHDYLLKSKSQYLASKCFYTLKRIEELHPSCLTGRQNQFNWSASREREYVIDWTLITAIVEQMELSSLSSKCQSSDKSVLLTSNATMALAFVVNAMEKEVDMKQFNLRQTIASRLLSMVRAPRNTVQVMTWLQECISSQVSRKSSTLSPNGKVIPFTADVPFSPLLLLQRLLQLSLSVSEDPDSCTAYIVGELLTVYTQLDRLEGRTLLLQTLNSPMLRSKLTDLILEVTCKAENNDSGDTIVGGINKIVQQHFERMPPKQDDKEFLGFRDVEGCLHSSEEVEEFVMLVAYSLQGYMFHHHKKLQGSVRSSGLCGDEDEEEVDPEPESHLSVLDVDALCNMGDNVMLLRARMMSLSPYLSLRTQQLLGFLSEEHMWDPW